MQASPLTAAPRFRTAQPVWPVSLSGEMNLVVGFRAVVDVGDDVPGPLVFRIATSTLYKAYVDGAFAGHGPARAAKGFFRVDALDWTDRLGPGTHVLVVEVAVYNTTGFHLCLQPEFLQAELTDGTGRTLASTGGDGTSFEACRYDERIQKVPMFSFLRGSFLEAWRLDGRHGAWRTDPTCRRETFACGTRPEGALLERGAPMPDFALRMPIAVVGRGTSVEDPAAEASWVAVFDRCIGTCKKGWRAGECEANPSVDFQHLRFAPDRIGQEFEDERVDGSSILALATGQYRILDFGKDLTGFFGATASCAEKTRLLFVFDELLKDGDILLERSSGTTPLVAFDLAPGTYALETSEVYTLRYLKVVVIDGSCALSDLHLREYANPEASRARFAASDERLELLYEAGRETFRQNAADLFTDCPSRERGGYLCDSFFTARASFALTGSASLERTFLENYLLFDGDPMLPEGMVPQNYPGDIMKSLWDAEARYGQFIPNWALWLFVELEEFARRSGDTAFAARFRSKAEALFAYLRGFENNDGLLEDIDGWVFVEWSKANDFVAGVNYPTNMLYAGGLAAAGRLFGVPVWLRRAEEVKTAIRAQSYDGAWFVDQALREPSTGALRATTNRSEACQYYAFFFDAATPETHPVLWRTLLRDFGPGRVAKGLHPEIDPANLFIGRYLRFDLMSRCGLGERLLEEATGQLLPMAERTGTIWEHLDDSASCCHGFGSHIVHWLHRNVLGVAEVDVAEKRVVLRFETDGPAWCEADVPIGDGALRIRVERTGGVVRFRATAPDGYALTIEAAHDARLEELT